MCAIVEINTLLTSLIMYYFQLLHRKPLIILYLNLTWRGFKLRLMWSVETISKFSDKNLLQTNKVPLRATNGIITERQILMYENVHIYYV